MEEIMEECRRKRSFADERKDDEVNKGSWMLRVSIRTYNKLIVMLL
jgi:hypothetical protein